MGGGSALTRILALCCGIVLLAITLACGGNVSTRSTTSGTPTSPSTAPSPSPAPTPSPTPTPTPTPSPTPPQYQVTLFSGTSSRGQATVDGSGNVSIQLTGAAASAAYTAQFCPFPTRRYSCINLNPVMTDATGAANSTFRFPTPGAWAGDFTLTAFTDIISTQVASNTGQVYVGTLLPAGSANGQGVASNPGSVSPTQDPGAGSVTVNGGNVHVVLTSAVANTTYAVVQCFPGGSPGCFQLGAFNANTFTTDASGNAVFDVQTAGIPGDFFTVSQVVNMPTGSLPPGLVAGFRAQ